MGVSRHRRGSVNRTRDSAGVETTAKADLHGTEQKCQVLSRKLAQFVCS